MRLETDRLILRSFEERDRAPFAAIVGDPHVMRFYPATRNADEANAWVDRILAGERRDGFSFLAVERKADGAFLGQTGIARFDYGAPDVSDVEVGWLLGSPYWGQGYAPEAARAALRHGFAELGLDEIVAFTATVNLPSQRVMQKLGMTHDAADDFDHPRIAEGHRLRRHVLYRARLPAT